ncbi:MAG TPA: hypothetical protein VGK23_08825 [Methanomassiliicoccales archaeon]|jgi:hypothetical protein
MSNKQLNDRCVIFVDQILNADEKDRTKEDVRSIEPEVTEKEGRFKIPCCEYLVDNIGRFKGVYDGHIGLEFSVDGEEYFEDFTNCPFCGAAISYAIRKTYKMVQGRNAGQWTKQEVD